MGLLFGPDLPPAAPLEPYDPYHVSELLAARKRKVERFAMMVSVFALIALVAVFYTLLSR